MKFASVKGTYTLHDYREIDENYIELDNYEIVDRGYYEIFEPKFKQHDKVLVINPLEAYAHFKCPIEWFTPTLSENFTLGYLPKPNKKYIVWYRFVMYAEGYGNICYIIFDGKSVFIVSEKALMKLEE